MKAGSIRIALFFVAVALGVGIAIGVGGGELLRNGEQGNGGSDSDRRSASSDETSAKTDRGGPGRGVVLESELAHPTATFPASSTGESLITDSHVSDRAIAAIRASVQDQSTRGKLEYLTLLQDLTPEQAPLLLGMFRELAHMGYKVAEYDRLLWERWAEIDGRGASETMFVRDRRFKETNLSKLAISTWAKNDPAAASDWLFQQDDIPLREGMTKGLLEGMAARDPAFAERFLENMDLPVEQIAYGYSQVARQFHIQHGLDAVGAWHRDFPADDPNYEIVANAATQIYARAAFADALDWADNLQGAPEVVEATRQQLHARLAYGRPDGLLTYLGNDPSANSLTGSSELVSRSVDRWIATNPNAMGEWLQDNPQLLNYDMLAAPFVEQIASQDIEAAEAWADTIRNADLRDAVKERIQNSR